MNHTSYGFVFPRRAVLTSHQRENSNQFKKKTIQQQQHQESNYSRSVPHSAFTGNY